MRCRFAVDVQVNPKSLSKANRKKIVVRDGRSYFPKGTEYSHPMAAFFVRQGMADPVDKPCKDAAGKSPAEIEELKRRFTRLERGIVPEDFELFDRGIIAGYDDDGDYVPGPNWSEYADAEEEEAAVA